MPNLAADTIREGLFTHLVGRRLLYYQELPSTMDEAARLARQDADEGTVVIAETQSAGRGRQGRSWVSQPGNLLLSALFRPTLPQLPFISIIGGLAAARAIRKTAALEPRIKWPNDVLLHRRKAAGILAESAIAGDAVWYAILGIGINVASGGRSLPELQPPAVGVNEAAGREIARESLLRQLLVELDTLYRQLQHGATPLPEWRGLLDGLGQRMAVISGGQSFEGVAEDVDETGNLRLRLDSGERRTFTSGDATLRR